MSNLEETWLKGEDVWVEYSKCLGISFPGNHPVRPSTPAIAVDEEGIVSVAQQELLRDALDMDWLDILLSLDEIE
jgi:hypothetical protein